jgi:5S rRNA maturation endonuclease (ribonuclease M5)
MVSAVLSLDEWIQEVKSSPSHIFVEGIEDKKALEYFGIKRVTIVKGKPLYEVAEGVKEKTAIILTDLDSEGKRLHRKLKIELSRNGVFVDEKPRLWLFRNTKLRQIQGLVHYYKKNQKQDL